MKSLSVRQKRYEFQLPFWSVRSSRHAGKPSLTKQDPALPHKGCTVHYNAVTEVAASVTYALSKCMSETFVFFLTE